MSDADELPRRGLDYLVDAPATPMWPCCDLHNRNCEPPSELCCSGCTEFHHGMHADPPNYDRTLTSHHDGSSCVLDSAADYDG
jgi:hypothetical protein